MTIDWPYPLSSAFEEKAMEMSRVSGAQAHLVSNLSHCTFLKKIDFCFYGTQKKTC